MSAPVRRPPSPREMQQRVDEWNAKHPAGTLVEYRTIKGGPVTHRGRTRDLAQLLGGHTAVLYIEGLVGCVALSHCTAVQQ